MDWHGGVYDSVISLGTNCAVATHLNENLLRTEAFPFDWLISADINKIRGLTESGFADFMRYENLKDMTPPGSASGHVVDEANGLRFFHDFCPRLLDVQYGQIREKYKNRTEAFMRRIGGGSKCLFVRQQAKDESLEYVAFEYLLPPDGKSKKMAFVGDRETVAVVRPEKRPSRFLGNGQNGGTFVAVFREQGACARVL